MNLRFKLQTVFLFFAICASAISASAQTLGDKIDEILKDPSLKGGTQAVMIRSLKTNQTLYEHNAHSLMLPASNFKLLVSAASLETLGPDFTFKTKVYVSGKVENGVLKGNLIIRGGGNPVLLTPDLTYLAKQVRSAGISQIDGNVIADESFFDNQRLNWGWNWADLGYYYAAETSALTLNRNTVDVYVYPAKTVGAAAIVKIVPYTDYLTINNSAKTGKPDSANAINVNRALGQNIIRVNGTIPKNAKITRRTAPVTVTEPGLYTACVFASELSQQKITMTGSVKYASTPENAKLIATHTSPPLSQILAMLNKPSDNLIAETLLKTIGAVVKGNGSTSAGIEVETEFFKKIGLDASEMSITDGSGLSRFNYISASNLVALLSYMHSTEQSNIFIDSLPVAGVNGSLSARMKKTSAQGNVKAKTGYIGRVSSLSGYVNTKSNEKLAFSIIMNHHSCKKSDVTKLQDKICVLLADLP